MNMVSSPNRLTDDGTGMSDQLIGRLQCATEDRALNPVASFTANNIPTRSWREAMEADILNRYDCFGQDGRYALLSAFDYTKDKLELESGDFTIWPDEDKVAVAQQLLQAAEEFRYINRDAACGAELLSLYLEAQTLLGEQAKRMISSIEGWYRRAIENEFNLFAIK
jgi:hypothetical protein